MESVEEKECNICCMQYTNKKRKIVTCQYCNFNSCLECFKIYILDTFEEPKCMACNKIFIQDFVSDNTTTSFYNKEYRNHRTEILFSTEKSLLPSTQHLAEQEKKCDLIYTEMNKIKSERKELKTQIDNLNRLLYQKERDLYRQQNMSDNNEETQRKQFTKKCQVENCRGYLSSAWKCGQCETF